MTRPAGAYPPNGERVAVVWLGQLDGIDASQVATTLPKDPAKWGDDPGAGFLQVTALANGGTDIDVPQRRRSVLQLDGWGAIAGSDKPQWAIAARLLELVRIATEDAQTGHYGMPLDLGADYTPVRVLAGYLISEPTRVLGDPSGYGRFTADLALDWVRQ